MLEVCEGDYFFAPAGKKQHCDFSLLERCSLCLPNEYCPTASYGCQYLYSSVSWGYLRKCCISSSGQCERRGNMGILPLAGWRSPIWCTILGFLFLPKAYAVFCLPLATALLLSSFLPYTRNDSADCELEPARTVPQGITFVTRRHNTLA